MTIGEALLDAGRRLRSGGSGPADARRLLAQATGWTGERLISRADSDLRADVRAQFDRFVARRAAGEPVAYIVGSAGFYGREFAVNADVLVPRPESEHVLEAALDELRSRPAVRRRVADIGTGSGILAISIACEIGDAHVTGTDASALALATARVNAASLGCGERVTFVEGDLARSLPERAGLDLVIANLPYVPSADVPPSPDPVSFEPRIAVDGGRDGLDLYRRLMTQLPARLAPAAALFFEAAPPTIDALASIVGTAFPRAHIEIGEDYAGLERFVAAHLP